MSSPDRESLIGQVFASPDTVTVTQESIDAFALAIGESATDVAPPTFAITITLDQSQGLLQNSGLDWTRVVHGDQKFTIARPIVAGDELACSSTIESVRILAGNEIVTVRSDLHNGDELVASSWSTLVVRA